MTPRLPCPGSGQPAKPDVPSYATTGICPACEHKLAIDREGRMRAHKAPSERQLERRREYLAYKERAVVGRV